MEMIRASVFLSLYSAQYFLLPVFHFSPYLSTPTSSFMFVPTRWQRKNSQKFFLSDSLWGYRLAQFRAIFSLYPLTSNHFTNCVSSVMRYLVLLSSSCPTQPSHTVGIYPSYRPVRLSAVITGGSNTFFLKVYSFSNSDTKWSLACVMGIALHEFPTVWIFQGKAALSSLD